MSQSREARCELAGQADGPLTVVAWLSLACAGLALPICILPLLAMVEPEWTTAVLGQMPLLVAGGMLALLGIVSGGGGLLLSMCSSHRPRLVAIWAVLLGVVGLTIVVVCGGLLSLTILPQAP